MGGRGRMKTALGCGFIEKYRDTTHDQLVSELGITPRKDAPLPIDHRPHQHRQAPSSAKAPAAADMCPRCLGRTS